jgi:hypothetical protein
MRQRGDNVHLTVQITHEKVSQYGLVNSMQLVAKRRAVDAVLIEA